MTHTNHLTQTLAMDNYQYIMECSGEGNPTLLLLGGRAATWKPIQTEMANFTRTCVFDHAGRRPIPLTAQSDCHERAYPSQQCKDDRSVCIGWFFCWWIYRTAICRVVSKRSCGYAFPDSSHEDQNARLLAALPPETPDECQELKDYRSELQSAHVLPIGPEITLDFDASAAEVRHDRIEFGQSSIGGAYCRPFTVAGLFSARIQKKLDQEWQAMQTDLASLSTNSNHVVAQESGHNFAEQPEMVIDAIQQSIDAVR